MLAILVEGRGTDRVQFAAREHRLEHIRSVHRTLDSAGTDDRVHFIDEDDDFAFRGANLIEDRLQAFFELAAVLGAREHRCQIELNDALVAEPLRYVAADDPLRQPLDDRRFSDTRLADQHRIVLRPAQQHLDDPADLFVTTDDRIELTLPGQRREVATVALQCLIR
ncbi:hypothetical protein HRbin27_01760 [bacterium HR27]|nr:hypothetical protein HRbin27_01760 [bacterium HR27]